jgi:hypothetical protein
MSYMQLDNHSSTVLELNVKYQRLFQMPVRPAEIETAVLWTVLWTGLDLDYQTMKIATTILMSTAKIPPPEKIANFGSYFKFVFIVN